MTDPLPDGILRTKSGDYVLEHDTHLSRWIEEHGRLDIAAGQISFFKHHIPPGGIVVDAGASLGDHTATYAKLVGPAGMVLAFEPQPLSYQALKLNMQRFPNVIPIFAGLGSRDGETVRMRTNPNAGRGFIADDGDLAINIRTLDAVLGDSTNLHFIHFDGEGYEREMLLGSVQIIRRCHPVIVIEVHHEMLALNGQNEASLRAFLRELGYEIFEIEPHHGPHLPQRDVIALPVA